ncbi:hypothetical protein EVAR_37929_1 [Eumeta japonica]|uniref:Uncharacterized protein n=1 Tax=Eumeta variegata TaxID=151549 RepID=A0A4C1XD96_EUMVA|nr:hypothetical protein EVAR_37929_1 [Eumeta japonica]
MGYGMEDEWSDIGGSGPAGLSLGFSNFGGNGSASTKVATQLEPSLSSKTHETAAMKSCAPRSRSFVIVLFRRYSLIPKGPRPP